MTPARRVSAGRPPVHGSNGGGSRSPDWDNGPSYQVGSLSGGCVTDEDLAALCEAIAVARVAASDKITDTPQFRVVFGGALRMRRAAWHYRHRRLHWSGRW